MFLLQFTYVLKEMTQLLICKTHIFLGSRVVTYEIELTVSLHQLIGII